MPRTLTASDRRSLIRLASTLPAGSPERKAILAGLKKAGRKVSIHEYTPKRGDVFRMPYSYGGREYALVKVSKDGWVEDGLGGKYISYEVVDTATWPEPLRVGERADMLVFDGDEPELDDFLYLE
jgi:hypothetical protein